VAEADTGLLRDIFKAAMHGRSANKKGSGGLREPGGQKRSAMQKALQ